MSASILVVGGTVITMDARRRVIANGGVVVIDGQIVAVGEAEELRARYASTPLLDAVDCLIVPGFIDAHGHAGHSFTRTLGSGTPGRWAQICEAVYARGADVETWRLDALLLGLDRLRNGVTTGATFLGGGGMPLVGDMVFRTDTTEPADAHLSAIERIGTRTVLAVGPRRPPYPRQFIQWTNGKGKTVEVSEDQQLRTCVDVARTWHQSVERRIHIAFASHVAFAGTGSDRSSTAHLLAQTRRVRSLARELGIAFMQDGHRRGSVSLLHLRGGGLGPDVLISHAVGLRPDEIKLCGRHHVAVVHNPASVASSTARCPVPELLAAGARVAIGSDASGPDRGCDLLRHAQLAMRMQRAALRDPTVLPEGHALEAITIGAATALGLDDLVGSLEVGKRGDIVIIDTKKPHLTPLLMPVHQLVDFASGADVDTVIVEGEPVLRNHVVSRVDESVILEEARRHVIGLLGRSGVEIDEHVTTGFWTALNGVPA